jgi:hypothetical protein
VYAERVYATSTADRSTLILLARLRIHHRVICVYIQESDDCAQGPPTCPEAQSPVAVVVAGIILAIFMLWMFYIMRNRHVLQHFTKKYEGAAHRLVPPLAAGGSLCTTAASTYALRAAVLTHESFESFRVIGSIFGILTGFCGLCFGVYSMWKVRRLISTGLGDTDEGLGAMDTYMRDCYSRKHADSAQAGACITDALMQRDFLQDVQRNEREQLRREERDTTARIVGDLEMDPADVVWHEDKPFAEGGFSTVWRVTYRGKIVAAKVLRRSQVAQSMHSTRRWLAGVEREVRILHHLSASENIINVLGVYERADGAVVFMEYASGGTLYDYLHGTSSRLTELETGTSCGGTAKTRTGGTTATGCSTGATSSSSQCNSAGGRSAPNDVDGGGDDSQPALELAHVLPQLELAEQVRILLSIASAMEFCQQQEPPISHRDLKPQNVLLSAHGQWVLADFGASDAMRCVQIVAHTRARVSCCSPCSPCRCLLSTSCCPPCVRSYSVHACFFA